MSLPPHLLALRRLIEPFSGETTLGKLLKELQDLESGVPTPKRPHSRREGLREELRRAQVARVRGGVQIGWRTGEER